MQLKVNDQEVLSLSETRKNVIKNDVASEDFDADMERRICWVCEHKYDQCFNRLKSEWDAKLAANGVESIPLDQDEYAELVFAQPNYKNKSARLAEEGE